MDDDIKKNLQVEDFVAFGSLLLISCIVGIYFAYKDRHNSTIDSYFFGDKNVHPVAVGLSLAVSFSSSLGIISTPAETYIVGDLLFLNGIIDIFASFLTLIYFVPAFHGLQIKTAFEYLDMRFNKYIGLLAAVMKMIGTVTYMGFVVYAPAAALSAVTPISINLSIGLTTGFCIFYTALGGMKAVIWTDAIQSFVMLIGILAIFIQGLIFIGGFENLYSAIERGERHTIGKLEYGLISRISPLAILLSGIGSGVNLTAFTQQMVQRYKSCKTVKQAQCAMLVYILPVTIFSIVNVANGLIMYAYYEGCDPVNSGQIDVIDQAIPSLVLDLFENLPGMAGVFIAAVFSGALSTVSSGINSFSIVIVEDMVSPCSNKIAQSEKLKLILGKFLVVALGLLIALIAFLASISSSNLFRLLTSFVSIIGGPIAGAYFLGFFFPWANSTGATVGLLSSMGFTSFLFVGSQFFQIPYPANIPPVSIDKCPQFLQNLTTVSQYIDHTTDISATTLSFSDGRSTLQDFYNLNYQSFIFFGILIVIIVGNIVSLVTGPNKPSEADPNLFIPLIDNPCFPVKMRKFFRLGVPEVTDVAENDIESVLEEKL